MKSPTDEAVERLREIERVAWLCTPDWDNWCGNASDRVSEYLSQQGIPHTVEDINDDYAPGWSYGPHTFIRLADGTVLDPTITQFVGEGHRRLRGGLSTRRTAVFPVGHPAHKMYDGSVVVRRRARYVFETRGPAPVRRSPVHVHPYRRLK